MCYYYYWHFTKGDQQNPKFTEFLAETLCTESLVLFRTTQLSNKFKLNSQRATQPVKLKGEFELRATAGREGDRRGAVLEMLLHRWVLQWLGFRRAAAAAVGPACLDNELLDWLNALSLCAGPSKPSERQ